MTGKRIGRISITTELIENHSDLVSEIFAKMRFIPTRCEHMWHMDRFEYYGLSEMFKEIPPEMAAPEYTINVTQNEDGTLDKVEVTKIY